MQTIRPIHYLKDSAKFEISQADINRHGWMLEWGRNEGKSIQTKKSKTSVTLVKPNHPWLVKQPISATEIMSSEVFRVLLGEQFSPKYRLLMVDGIPVATITKLMVSFTPKGMLFEDKVNYLSFTSSITGFNKMVAVCFLLGKDDLHGGNWGYVELNGKRYVATVDHDQALKKKFFLYNFLYKYGHRKEQFLTQEFVDTCRQVISEYMAQKSLIIQKLKEASEQLNTVIPDDVLTVDNAIEIIEFNKELLEKLTYQIEAEIAIKRGDTAALEKALRFLPEEYFGNSGDKWGELTILSNQNDDDGCLQPNDYDLRRLIKESRKDHLPLERFRIEGSLLAVYDRIYLEKAGSLSCDSAVPNPKNKKSLQLLDKLMKYAEDNISKDDIKYSTVMNICHNLHPIILCANDIDNERKETIVTYLNSHEVQSVLQSHRNLRAIFAEIIAAPALLLLGYLAITGFKAYKTGRFGLFTETQTAKMSRELVEEILEIDNKEDRLSVMQ